MSLQIFGRSLGGRCKTRLLALLLGWLLTLPALAIQHIDPSQAQRGSDIYLSQTEYEQIIIQASQYQQAAIDSADQCDEEGKKRAVNGIKQLSRYANASMLRTAELMRRMALQLQQILNQLGKFVPSGDPNKPALDQATGALQGWATGAVEGEIKGAAEALPVVGNALSLLNSLSGVADDIDKMNEASEIYSEANRQYQEILKAELSLGRWKRLNDLLLEYFEAAASYPVRTDCDDPDEDAQTGVIDSFFNGTRISIGTDSTEWCTYREGTPTTFTPGGTSVPPGQPPVDGGSQPPGESPPGGGTMPPGGQTPDDGEDPGDGIPPGESYQPETPCERHLYLLETYMRMHGEAHRARAATNAQDARDLQQIEERIDALRKVCGRDGSDPRDTTPPGGTTTTGTPPPLITSVPRDDSDDSSPPPESGDEPQEPGEPTVTIYVKAKASATSGQTQTAATAGQQVKLFAVSTANVALPGPGTEKPQTDHDQDPIQGVTDDDGNVILLVPGSAIGLRSSPTDGTPALEIAVDTTQQSSVNAQLAGDNTQAVINALPAGLAQLLTDANTINGTGFLTFSFPASMANSVNSVLIRIPGVIAIQVNYCRDKQAAPNDTLFAGNQAWGQKYDNQWAIKQVGMTAGNDSAWNMLGNDPKPVVVAVIDTGLDWNHLDINWDNIWQNPGEVPANGLDDDGNGYIDDQIGWDFFADTNNPWDHDGHGTFVAGVIAADTNNETGIAGINPHARIMVLKALNNFGHTRASYLAKAIVYAVDNGARIINMSVGGKEVTTIEQEAIKYAASKGVLVVVASGNEGIDVSEFGVAGLDSVLTVAATNLNDQRAPFSNSGAAVDIAAPGIEVLSLRARRTDTMRDIPGVEYDSAGAYVGEDKRYYRASGTSFAAPIVAGVASLLLSANPDLTAAELDRMLTQSARDVEVPGFDQITGHGIVDARAALAADPEFFIDAAIARVEVVQESGRTFVRVVGSADADHFESARVELGAGERPDNWKTVLDKIRQPVRDGVLGDIDANEFQGAAQWTLRVIIQHKNGTRREARFALNLG